MLPKYSVVDLFAGPGGLSEGFAQVRDRDGNPFYEIVLSVEKEASAHKTLTLRSMVHQLNDDQLRLYRSTLNNEFSTRQNDRGPDIDWSEVFPDQWGKAQRVALQLELGTSQAESVIDERLDEIGEDYGGNTVLIGGPPCQAYSLVGRARNMGNPDYRAADDGRHYLYREYIRILDQLRPAVFVMENVKGILSSRVDGTPIFPMILEDLSQIAADERGYELITLTGVRQPTLLNEPRPQDFIVRTEDRGVPQARHRVIVVGIRRKDIGLAMPPEVRERGLLGTNISRAVVSDVLSGMPPLRSRLSRGHDSDENWTRVVGDTFERLLGEREIRDDPKLLSQLESAERDFKSQGPLPTREPRVLDEDLPPHLADWIRTPGLEVLPSHETRGHIPEDLGRYVFAAAFATAHKRSPKAHEFPKLLIPNHSNWDSGKFNDRFRVQRWDAPSSTVTSHISKDGHYYIHPDPAQARSLTVREAARLQTFPDDYLFLGNRTQQYVQVGNAVPAYLAFQIATEIAEQLP
jgi:DNA (cytosine-5)-methyltransferase 1